MQKTIIALASFLLVRFLYASTLELLNIDWKNQDSTQQEIPDVKSAMNVMALVFSPWSYYRFATELAWEIKAEQSDVELRRLGNNHNRNRPMTDGDLALQSSCLSLYSTCPPFAEINHCYNIYYRHADEPKTSWIVTVSQEDVFRHGGFEETALFGIERTIMYFENHSYLREQRTGWEHY